MTAIELTMGQVALVDDEDFEELSKFKWYAWKGGRTFYACRNIQVAPGKRATIKMHRQLMRPLKGCQVDHINHIGTDNQRHNLRICKPPENTQNCQKSLKNASGFIGVDRHKNRWRARARHNGKLIDLGYFLTAEEAATARDEKVTELRGEFAVLNFP